MSEGVTSVVCGICVNFWCFMYVRGHWGWVQGRHRRPWRCVCAPVAGVCVDIIVGVGFKCKYELGVCECVRSSPAPMSSQWHHGGPAGLAGGLCAGRILGLCSDPGCVPSTGREGGGCRTPWPRRTARPQGGARGAR